MKINITYIISDIGKALAFEWIVMNIDKNKFQLNFVLINPDDSNLEQFLKANDVKVDRITYTGKKDLLKSVLKVGKILKRNKTAIVHTHLIKANLIGITAAWLNRIPRRIHTRHHSDYHHIYYPKAVKYDKYVNKKSTHIVSISNVVSKILQEKENVSADKIHVIHHGFKLSEFENADTQKLKILQDKYNPLSMSPVIGVISRYTHWKGIQYIIPAFKKILANYPDALLILANAQGDFKQEITDLLKSIPEKNRVEINFEPDIFTLYHLFDVFVHVPISEEAEAFGQIYIEALAAGIPSVFTLSGIANEFIKDEFNALVVPYKDADAINHAIMRILTNKDLSKKIIENGKMNVKKEFELMNMISSLEKLYEQ